MTTADLSKGDAERQSNLADERDLSRFGYGQQLRRTMSSFTSFCLAFSMITITGTLVGLFQPALSQVGGVAIWMWLIALLGVMLVMYVFMHMAARIPVTGYAYQWTSRITNSYYGWVVAVFGIITFTTGAVSIGVLLGAVYAPEFGFAATAHNAAYLSAAALTLGVIINAIGIKITGRVNNIAAILEMVGTTLIVLLLLAGTLFWFHRTQGFGVINNHGAAGVPGTHLSFVTYLLASTLPVLSLLGWEASADLAEETVDPRKTAPRAMFRAVIVSGIAGFFVMWIWAAAIKGSIPHAVAQQNSFFYVVDADLGRYAGWFIATVGFVSMMGCIIANIAVATRLLFSVSRDRLLPGSKQLAYVHTPEAQDTSCIDPRVVDRDGGDQYRRRRQHLPHCGDGGGGVLLYVRGNDDSGTCWSREGQDSQCPTGPLWPWKVARPGNSRCVALVHRGHSRVHVAGSGPLCGGVLRRCSPHRRGIHRVRMVGSQDWSSLDS